MRHRGPPWLRPRAGVAIDPPHQPSTQFVRAPRQGVTECLSPSATASAAALLAPVTRTPMRRALAMTGSVSVNREGGSGGSGDGHDDAGRGDGGGAGDADKIWPSARNPQPELHRRPAECRRSSESPPSRNHPAAACGCQGSASASGRPARRGCRRNRGALPSPSGSCSTDRWSGRRSRSWLQNACTPGHGIPSLNRPGEQLIERSRGRTAGQHERCSPPRAHAVGELVGHPGGSGRTERRRAGKHTERPEERHLRSRLFLAVPAKLPPHRRQHLVGEIGAAARAENIVQRGAQHRRGHTLINGGGNGPAAFAGIRDTPGELLQGGVRGQRCRRIIEQPRRHDAAAPPDSVIAAMSNSYRYCSGCRIGAVSASCSCACSPTFACFSTFRPSAYAAMTPYIDAVVDHLDEVAGAVRAAVQVSAFRRADGRGLAARRRWSGR